MIWIVLVVLTILAMITVSFVFGSSTYSSMPGVKVNLGILGGDELLMPECDRTQGAMFQDKHGKASRLVSLANHYCKTQGNLEAASQALLQAVRCYEEIRDIANSAVVELNLAILAKARIKLQQEWSVSSTSRNSLDGYVENALSRAEWFLNKEPERYENEVRRLRRKLKAA